MNVLLPRREAGHHSPKHSPRFATRTTRRIGEGTRNVIARLGEIRQDEQAVGNIASIGLTIALVIVGAVVAVSVLSALTPTYSSAVGNISENITTADWGDDTANSIGPVFGMVIALGGLFAIIGLVFLAFKLRKNGS